MDFRLSKEQHYLAIAREVARRSNCVKRQIGAIIVLEDRIISTGYNGTPRGIKNCFEGGCARCNDATIPSGEKLDVCWCCHAEENCIVQAAYHGISVKNGGLYTTFSPCIACAKLIVNAGIRKVGYWGEYPQQSASMLEQAQVELVRLV